MLETLAGVVSDSQEIFNGIVWQLVCCPFTAFLVLFGEIISTLSDPSRHTHNQELLASMELLPSFLQKMAVRNSLAGKLEKIAVVFVQHASSVLASKGQSVPVLKLAIIYQDC